MITTTKILKAIEATAPYYPTEWIDIAAIRDEVGGSRQDFDQALTELAKSGQVHAIAEENQKTLTPARRYNAVTIGGDAKHLVAIA